MTGALLTTRPASARRPLRHRGARRDSLRAAPATSAAAQLQTKSCACGGSCPRCQGLLPIQPKLTIGAPNDPYEQEADRVADQVMRMPESDIQRQPVTAFVQGEADVEEDEAGEPIQLKGAESGASPEPAHPADRLNSLKGRGQPLSRSIRNFFEPRLGYDLSQVQVHADARAAESAQAVNAQAYTVGRNIVFAEGRYAPHTTQGRRSGGEGPPDRREAALLLSQRAASILITGSHRRQRVLLGRECIARGSTDSDSLGDS